MKLGVIGRGFVGTALIEGMKHAFDIFSYDIRDGLQWSDGTSPPSGGIDKLVKLVDGPIFVCVPTPMNSDGSCNTDIVEQVVSEINQYADNHVIAIKSTVVPGTSARLNEKYENVTVCFNPEFLREVSSVDDFKNQDRIILGGPHVGTAVLKQVYETAYPDVPVTKTSSSIAEMIKYTTNCFLATKVAFANELKQACDLLEIDYDKVVEYATKDQRLGTSHWSVPGPDGKYGFGGSCFPKDLNAMIHFMKSSRVVPNIMEAAWFKNLEVRPEKDWEDLKGRAVNE